eukprot:3423821-Pyramimonas_sp.AAC.3
MGLFKWFPKTLKLRSRLSGIFKQVPPLGVRAALGGYLVGRPVKYSVVVFNKGITDWQQSTFAYRLVLS